jgi:hypothetical protein
MDADTPAMDGADRIIAKFRRYLKVMSSVPDHVN